MLEVLNSDYVRTARAKGLVERRVVMKHAFRNALIPLTTLALGAVKEDEVASAAGVMNFLRTMSGAVGTAVAMTIWYDGAQGKRAELSGVLNGADQTMQSLQMQDAGTPSDEALTQLATQHGMLWVSLGPVGFQRKFFLLSPHTLLFVVLAVGSLGMLHLLNEVSPRTALALLPMATTSPARTADELERRFDRLGFGIPRCTPLGCDRQRASALRTFAFGMLETVLGYTSGQLDRRPYADAVASLALSVQIGDDGVVRAADRVAYRPALRGGFLSYWNRDRRYLKPSGVAQAVADRFNMPPEYLGLRPTDSETGFDAYAFLALYRCARYKVGCKLVGPARP